MERGKACRQADKQGEQSRKAITLNSNLHKAQHDEAVQPSPGTTRALGSGKAVTGGAPIKLDDSPWHFIVKMRTTMKMP